MFFVWCWFEILKRREAKAKYDSERRVKLWAVLLEKQARYRTENRERLCVSRKTWYDKHREDINADRRRVYASDSEPILRRNRAWKQRNPDKAAESYRAWAAKNPERRNRNVYQWIQKNRDRRNQTLREWARRRVAEIPVVRLLLALRSRVACAMKAKASKSASTRALLGCSVEDLKRHLEIQFRPGMSWDNYGDWHVDHIRPCASFDLTDPEQQRACFNFKNLQPLWAKDNLSKGAKYDAKS